MFAFAMSPAPLAVSGYQQVGVSSGWSRHHDDFASRWNKNRNQSWQADTWCLNLFPREEEFKFNRGGYATLSFGPTMDTMLIGLIAGVW